MPGGECDERDERDERDANDGRAPSAARPSLRGGAADAAIQFHPLTISRRIDILTTRKAKPLDCRVGFASSQ
ncbi:hypothetical protein E4Q23_11000 [Candidatus Accumulibacter phosphatis]|uniref:Uncharacterized protein n=1 Tax=Candidatus Accumulibacter phosphatis TaxID=327160 RepID=A0ABX1TXR3_9PROT|nr:MULTISPECIES: hypothetical protein [Candidatus Accumulibacter]NMQ28235.1 hypothetical protein [Candidatus Accumulibacter phosphatis]